MGDGGGGLKLFISYRREDSIGIAGRIRDRLAHEFGRTNVFFDVDAIPLGTDFRAHIERTIAHCDAVLVVIGPRWVVNKQGQRRLDIDGDFVRLEVEAALSRDIPVVPLLVDDATIPRASQIPASIADLTNRNGIPVRHDPDFHTDLDRLIRSLEQSAAREPDKPPPAATPPPRKVSPKQSPEKKPVDVDSPVARPTQRQADVPVSRQSLVRAHHPGIDAVVARQTQPVGWLARQRATIAYDRAVARANKGDLDAAIVHATKAIEANPKHATAFWFRAGVRKQRGDIDGAIADYTEAFRLDPRYALALYDRGRLREEQGDLAAAADDYARCRELAPDNAEFKQAVQRVRRS